MTIYKVKVNGKVYEVELEAVSEIKGSIETPKTSAPVVSAPVSGGSAKILAPIGGKVLDVKVSVGDTIKKGQVVAIIEAMKLENEVPATAEGKVVEIKVTKGSMVNNQDVMIILG